MMTADPGCLLVAADLDKVEVRWTAILAGDRPFLDAFAEGRDTHMENARAMFGPNAGDLERDMGKIAAHGFDYGCSAETMWTQLVKKFPKLPLELVKRLRAGYLAAHPAIVRWQRNVVLLAQRRGLVEAPVGYRRLFFPDAYQVDPNVVANFGPQAAVAWGVQRAHVRLAKEGWDQRINCHDEIVLNVPKVDVIGAGIALKAALEEPVEYGGRQWVFPAELKVGTSWGTLRPWTEAPALMAAT